MVALGSREIWKQVCKVRRATRGNTLSLFGRITAIIHAPMLLPIVATIATGAAIYRAVQPRQQQQTQSAVAYTPPPESVGAARGGNQNPSTGDQSGTADGGSGPSGNTVSVVMQGESAVAVQAGGVSTPGQTQMTIQASSNPGARYQATGQRAPSAVSPSHQVQTQSSRSSSSTESSGSASGATVR